MAKLGIFLLCLTVVTYAVHGEPDESKCQSRRGTCVDRRSRCRGGRKWDGYCGIYTRVCCIKKSFSRDVRCVKIGGNCMKTKDCKGGANWLNLCGRKSRRTCCLYNSVSQDHLCVKERGGFCADQRVETCDGGQYRLGVCSANSGRECCIPDLVKGDDPCFARGGVCIDPSKRERCYNGRRWKNYCGGNSNRICCILGSRQRYRRCVRLGGRCVTPGADQCSHGQLFDRKCGRGGKKCCVTPQIPFSYGGWGRLQ